MPFTEMGQTTFQCVIHCWAAATLLRQIGKRQWIFCIQMWSLFPKADWAMAPLALPQLGSRSVWSQPPQAHPRLLCYRLPLPGWPQPRQRLFSHWWPNVLDPLTREKPHHIHQTHNAQICLIWFPAKHKWLHQKPHVNNSRIKILKSQTFWSHLH